MNKAIPPKEREQWQLRTFHKTRKCFATNFVTHCYEDGFDPYIFLPQALGHDNLLTTFKYIYFEALLNQRPEIISELSLKQTQLHKNRYGSKKDES